MPVLQDAFREAVRREFASIPEENELDWEFSDSFQKQMEKLVLGQTMKRCFFIGHRDAPDGLQQLLDEAIETCIRAHHINQFVVGCYGSFDRMVTGALVRAKKRYPAIQLLRLTPYHPSEKHIELPSEFDGTLYPEGMETVPRRFAIVRANQYMVNHCDRLIVYVRLHGSGAGRILKLALHKGLDVINLAVIYKE